MSNSADQPAETCPRCSGYAKCYCGPAYEERQAICDLLQAELQQATNAHTRAVLHKLHIVVRSRNATFDRRDGTTK